MNLNTQSAASASTPAPDDSSHGFGLKSRVIVGTLAGLLLIGGCGGWAAMAELTGAVIAGGTLKIEQNLKSIQHLDGGIIGSIDVKEGDVIAKGQIMIRLDDTQNRAELSIIKSQIIELSARRARLIAERDGQDAMDLPELLTSDDGSVIEAVRGEQHLLEGNRQNRSSKKEQLLLGIEQLQEEIHGLQAQRNSKSDEIVLVTAEKKKLSGLAEKKLIDSSRTYGNARELVRLVGEKGETDAGIARATARLSETRLQIISIDETARTDAQKELSEIEPKLFELKERQATIKDRLSRTDIRAPIAGTVNELLVHTVGGIITPAQKIMTIVPADALLKVEAKLSPNDIDQVFLGQQAKLRFTTFDQRTTPEMKGEITYISAATSVDEATGQTYYVANVSVSASELVQLGDRKLMPGMPVEVFISTERRTALSYLAKPMMDQFVKAFRE
jgi:HlyD family type I secretion membrane fusion protein